ncbi:MAG: Smr/MutS family protein, partial [Clostridia bacterium]|nr:Smr/MutS family protein [Clostridia bacterium]
DVSASGATVFVEPIAVVEANNEITSLMAEEKNEIERILAEFSARTFEHKEALINDYKLLTELDIIFGRAKLALATDSFKPKINTDGYFDLIRARHPLLDPKKVVPIDICLGGEYNTLIITGPNTGGKTVSLKTLGLLSLMAMCGLHIPAAEGSTVSVCSAVLADIGDEQSIEQSLSTFSSHMKNIVTILDNTASDSLVLFDELGAGTDPTEGAALAIAIIERAAQSGARIAATTHYAELKVYALNTSGVENACCEFDVETLKPTYRLLTGIPGRSNAFAISKRLGLPDEVIEHARGLVNDETLRFEDVIDRLEEARIKTEEERRKAEGLRREIEELSVKAREREKHFDEERAKFTANARAEGDRILRDTRAEAAALIAEIRDILNRKDASPIDLNEVHANVNRRLNELENKSRKDAAGGSDTPVPELERMPEVGETVHLRKMGVDGVVLKKPKDGFVSVQAGILKMNVALADISLIPKAKAAKPVVSSGVTVKTVGIKDAAAAYRCDLRGMTADEALAELDIFVNRAVMQHMPAATIVHGKGTGKLRDAAQDYLRHNRFVKSFRLGVYGEGDSGVTVVEFKNN